MVIFLYNLYILFRYNTSGLGKVKVTDLEKNC